MQASVPCSRGDVELERDIWWQAIRSRDSRFDGRFFVAAVTTGIYCRPVCPVPFAKPNHIALFASADSAEAAGFRPCRRCRPETAPDTPAWRGTSAVVARALRLIEDGGLDHQSVDTLAQRVGIGARQLRRLFVQHVGAPPVKIAGTHRLQFARKLIEQTDLSMAEIALNAGYQSIRQFNHAVRIGTGQSPNELRHLRDESQAAPRRGAFVMRLRYRPPFDWSTLMAFLGARATPGVELVGEASYQRTVRWEGAEGTIEVRPTPDDTSLTLRIALSKYGGLLRAVERVRRIFDLGAEPVQIAGHLSQDRRLKPLVEARPGLRVPGAWDGFEIAVRAVLGENWTAVDSQTLAGRFVQAFGKRIETSVDGLTHLFPQPEDLASADLISLGISRKRAASIRALARAVCNHEFSFESSRSLQDTISQLTAIWGIHQKTAHYIAMRAFAEPDAFLPTGEAERETERWRPWRAYAAMYLWAERAIL